MTHHVQRSKQLVLGELLHRWVTKAPDREAFVSSDRRLSYGELDHRANRLANGLAGLGVGAGDRVGLIFTNTIEHVECAFALARLGAVGVPANFRFGAEEHAYQLAHSEAKALVFADRFGDVVDAIRAELPELKHLVCAGKVRTSGILDYEHLIQDSSPNPPEVQVDDDQPTSIMYTSGTTGRPKGAVLTHKNLAMAALTYGLHVGSIEGWRVMIVLPVFHMAAYATVVLNVFAGATTVLSDSPEPEAIMATIQDEKIEMTTLVPALWNWVVHHPDFDRYDLSSLRIGFTGAAVMPMELKRTIAERLPNLRLMEAFGMTETSACGTIADHKALFERHGSVGRCVVPMEVRVVDDNDRDVPVGEIGEIVYRGPALLKEYYKNPKATDEAFRGGWFHSGDLVRQDEDGFIYVVDRKKDIIISGGENISAAEVEEALYAHPAILDAAVVAAPDERWGESVKAFVVLHAETTLTEEEVIAHCRKRMASFKKPRSVEFVEELPRTATGKVKKFELRELERARFREARRNGSAVKGDQR